MTKIPPVITTQASYFNALVNVSSKADRIMELIDGGKEGGDDWITATQELEAALSLLAEAEDGEEMA